MQKITDKYDTGWMEWKTCTWYGKWVGRPRCILCDRLIPRRQILCQACKRDYKQVKGLNMRIGE